MINKKNSLLFGILLSVLLIGYGMAEAPRLEREILQCWINIAARDFFSGSVRLRDVQIDPSLKLRIHGITGNLNTSHGPHPILIRSIESKESPVKFILGKPLEFHFEGVASAGPAKEGIYGKAVLRGWKNWAFELEVKADHLGLEEIRWLNPENLTGATGDLAGEMVFKTDAHQNTDFKLRLRVQEPGGSIPSQFFDLLLPYLPQLKNQEKINEIRAVNRLLAYRHADLRMNLLEPDKMKIYFHILIPDYNVDLNLNVELRIDQKNAFMQAAGLMGLFQIKTS